jgi:hypothetical protein
MYGNNKQNIGYDSTIFISSNKYTYSIQALNWKNRIIEAGGSIDNNVLQIIDTNLFKPMVTSGIFNCLDKLHLFAGTGNRTAAKINLISNLYTAIENNATNLLWVNIYGFSSSTNLPTSGYLTFGYNPSTAAKWGADRFNCCQFNYYYYTDGASIQANIMGNGSGASSKSAALVRTSTGLLQVFMNQTATTANYPMTFPNKQWLCGTRTANSVKAIVNNNFNTFNLAPSATILSQDIGELCILGNTTNVNLDRSAHLASGHGNNNFDNQLLRTYILNTYSALGI